MNTELVTVIVAAFNAEKTLAGALESVLAQTYSNFELLVIDDHSTDDTLKIAQWYAAKDVRIHVYHNPRNLGAAGTRNRGLDLAKGTYIALLDSDDIWYPGKLEAQIHRLAATEASLICTSYVPVDAINQKRLGIHKVPSHIVYEDMLSNNLIGCSTVLLKQQLMDKYRFSDSYFHEDYALWLEILRDGNTAIGLPEVFVDYRVDRKSKSGNKMKSAWHRWQIYRRLLQLPYWQCITYSIRYMRNGIKKYRRIVL